MMKVNTYSTESLTKLVAHTFPYLMRNRHCSRQGYTISYLLYNCRIVTWATSLDVIEGSGSLCQESKPRKEIKLFRRGILRHPLQASLTDS